MRMITIAHFQEYCILFRPKTRKLIYIYWVRVQIITTIIWSACSSAFSESALYFPTQPERLGYMILECYLIYQVLELLYTIPRSSPDHVVSIHTIARTPQLCHLYCNWDQGTRNHAVQTDLPFTSVTEALIYRSSCWSALFTSLNSSTPVVHFGHDFPGRNDGRNFSGIRALTAVKISHRSRY